MEKNGVVDIYKTMEPEKSTGGGLYVPSKDRVVYVPQERKSRLGLDVLANAKKQGESQSNSGFKVPKERTLPLQHLQRMKISLSPLLLMKMGVVGVLVIAGMLIGDIVKQPMTHHKQEFFDFVFTESSVTEDRYGDASGICSTEHMGSDVPASPSGNDRADHRNERRHLRDESRSGGRSVRHRDNYGSKEPYSERDSRSRYNHDYSRHKEPYSERDSCSRYGHEYSRNKGPYSERDSRNRYDYEYSRKRNRYESSMRTPGRSDWDDGQWEWEDTPQRDNVSGSRRHQPLPSPMFHGASPDARLVSPWLGGNTPHSSFAASSPWDHVCPSPVPIHPSGSSVKSSTSRHSGRSHQLTFSSAASSSYEEEMGDKSDLGEEHKYGITESMRVKMEYDAD